MRRILTVLLIVLAATWIFTGVPRASDDDTDAGAGPDPKKIKKEAESAIVPKTREQLKVPDDVLRSNLKEAYTLTRTVSPIAVDASVSGGEVTLRGKVGSLAEKNLADAVARTCPGVRKVRNNLIVSARIPHPWPQGDPRGIADVLKDEKILKEVRKKVAASALVRLADVKLEIYLGVVVISGPVESEEVRAKLREVILFSQDVRAVVNHTWVAGQ
jgi:osmotically-inducible protein OsmY